MSILSGCKKIKKYVKESSGYKLLSLWTNAQSVEFDDGTNLEDKMKLKADKNSPTLTGTPKAPTATAGTSTTQIATTAFVQNVTDNKIAGLINGAPTTLDTLGEIADVMAENESVVEALNEAIGKKIDTINGDTHIESTKSGSAVAITHKNISRTNTSSTASPSNGGTFTAIDSVTSDAKGHITKVNTKTITLPTFKDVNITPEDIGAARYAVVETGDFNDMTIPGLYAMTNVNTNAPTTGNHYSLIVLRSDSDADVQQIAIKEGTSDVYVRYGSNGTWGNWVKLMAAGDTAVNAAMLGGHTSSWFEEGRWILHRETIDLNYFTAFGVDSLSLKGNSIEIGQHTDVVVLGVTNTLCWLAGWSYSGLTLSINVVTHNNNEASATVCFLTRG